MRKVSALALVLGVLALALAPAAAYSECAGHSTKVSSTTTTTSGQSTGDSSVAENPTASK